MEKSQSPRVVIEVDSSRSAALLAKFADENLTAEDLAGSEPKSSLATHSLRSGLGQLATIAVAAGTPAAIHLLAMTLKALVESSLVNVRIKVDGERSIAIRGKLSAEEIERLIRESLAS